MRYSLVSQTHFSQVTPWLGFAWDIGQDVDADHVASPRIWKCHQLVNAAPRVRQCRSQRIKFDFQAFLSFCFAAGLQVYHDDPPP
jgi:hypothetical protein